MCKTVPNSVKIAVKDCIENIHPYNGSVKTTQIQNKLVTDYGILFFDVPLLENLIKEELKDDKI